MTTGADGPIRFGLELGRSLPGQVPIFDDGTCDGALFDATTGEVADVQLPDGAHGSASAAAALLLDGQTGREGGAM